jgi:hypothetical protein
MLGALATGTLATGALASGCSEDPCERDEDCLPPAATLEVTSPAPGEDYDPEVTDICWRDTAPEGSRYEVDVVYERCPDEAALAERAHPYGQLLPDPQDRERLRDLRRQRRNLQGIADYWSGLCAQQSGEAARVAAIQAALDTQLQRLDSLIASEGLGIDPPAACHLEDECCGGQPCCVGLDLTTTEGRETYAKRLRCLENKVRGLESIRLTSMAEFQRLLARWRSGADHRATMAFYDDYFQLIDDTIGIVTDLVDVITGEILQSALQDYLTNETCELYPDECDDIRNAGDAADTLDTLRSLISSARAGNGMPPMFILQMVQAMAQTAGNATSVAVEGWENFALTMNAQLQQAYLAALCQKQFLALQALSAAECAGACQAAAQAAQDEVEAVDTAITELTDLAVGDRRDFWRQQKDDLNADLQSAASALSDDQLLGCCDEETGSSSYAVPGDEGPCVDLLSSWLYQAVGERACYHDWTVEVTCSATGIALAASYSFPRQERRADCCDPEERVATRERLGDGGQAQGTGEERCLPGSADEEPAATRARIAGQLGGRAGSRVQVRSRDGQQRVDAESSPQPLSPTGGSFVPPPDPGVPIQCDCTCDAWADSVSVTSGTALARSLGDVLQVSTAGDCGPSCAAGAVDISVQPPPLTSAANPQGQPVPTRVLPQPSAAVAMDRVGTWRLEAQRTCGDGATCQVAWDVHVTLAEAPPAPDPATLVNATPGGCGDMPCLELSYSAPNDVAGEFLFNYASLPATAVPQGTPVMLQLASDCYRGCADPAYVTWAVKDPNGVTQHYSGPGLYMLELPMLADSYTLCVTEVGGCLGTSYAAQRYFVLERL